jgi:hypothetical protein
VIVFYICVHLYNNGRAQKAGGGAEKSQGQSQGIAGSQGADRWRRTVYVGGNSMGPLGGAGVRDPDVGGGPMLHNDPRTDRHDANIA